jgi:hypothetical protein
LAFNCAKILGQIKDSQSYNEALNTLKTGDEFTQLDSVKFLCAYNNKEALPHLFNTLKTSSMAENIACEIIYLEDIFQLLKDFPIDTLLLINLLINGLGEIVPLSVIFDIRLYEIIEHINSPLTLLNIKQKIEQLTENNEYLFDEDKTVKDEIFEIKNLLNSKSQEYWDNLCDLLEIKEDDFIFFNLNIINELKLDYSDEIKDIIMSSSNQTIILKSIEVIKNLGNLSIISKDEILKKINDENIKVIIESYYN